MRILTDSNREQIEHLIVDSGNPLRCGYCGALFTGHSDYEIWTCLRGMIKAWDEADAEREKRAEK